MSKSVNAAHGIVCRLPGEKFGYFGWPSVARMDDGTLAVISSGLRSGHVCPWGKTVLNLSRDDGRTWSPPQVIQKSPLDDRDAGVLSLGGKQLLVSWFTSDTRQYLPLQNSATQAAWQATLKSWTDEMVKQWLGSWVILSADGGASWSQPFRAPVTAPHGPIRLRSGHLLYLGKPYRQWGDLTQTPIRAARSADLGRTWTLLGEVPLLAGTQPSNYHEPHVLELPSGKLIGMIRLENSRPDADVTRAGLIHFSIVQTESIDGGQTWSRPRALFYGSPPHLLRHSSGALVLSYGYRQAPFGQRAAISRDEGRTWDADWVIRADGLNHDLGYPCTVELGDGRLFTVYYQQFAAGEPCSLLGSCWALPVNKTE